MTHSPTIQTQIKGLELAHSIHTIYEPLEGIMGTSFRSKASGSPCTGQQQDHQEDSLKGSSIGIDRVAEALNRINDTHCNEHLQEKKNVCAKGYTV